MSNKNYYTFRASNGLVVAVLRGEDSPRMVGGGSGWSIESRPHRVGLTIWQGRDPYQMDVPVLFDGWMDGRSQENAISMLNQMQMGENLKEPPTVIIDGSVPVKGARWVMSPEIEWGTNVIWDGDHRLRQDALVHLTAYTPEQRLRVLNKGVVKVQSGVETVRKGDTFKSISLRRYGTTSKWKQIMSANNIRDPKAITKMVGKQIRIP